MLNANLVACLTLALAAISPPPQIAGTIVDPSGKLAAGVPLSVVAINADRTMATTVSEANGSFHFSGLAPGGYGIVAKTASACAISGAVRVDAGLTSIVRLRLTTGLCEHPVRFANPPAAATGPRRPT